MPGLRQSQNAVNVAPGQTMMDHETTQKGGPGSHFVRRREAVFIVLAGLFLGTLAMLNVLGVTRFVDLSFGLPGTGLRVPMIVAVGVLPYPVTFLCTDFISEFYGRRRATLVVWTGLLLNLWVMAVLWLAGTLPGAGGNDEAFFAVRRLAFSTVSASMIAYLSAQFIDVQLFHMWKRLTAGRHLWLRNNGSTMVSQLVDTVAVILVTHFWAHGLPVDESAALGPQLGLLIASGYAFKVIVAAVDTLPFYLGVSWLGRYLGYEGNGED